MGETILIYIFATIAVITVLFVIPFIFSGGHYHPIISIFDFWLVKLPMILIASSLFIGFIPVIPAMIIALVNLFTPLGEWAYLETPWIQLGTFAWTSLIWYNLRTKLIFTKLNLLQF